MEATGAGGLSIVADLTNSDVVEALGTSNVTFSAKPAQALDITNTDGTIGALTTGSQIKIGAGPVTFTGGVLTTVAGAKVSIVNNPAEPASLNVTNADIDNAGSVVLANSTALTLNGDEVDNSGTIALDAAANLTNLVIAGTVDLRRPR